MKIPDELELQVFSPPLKRYVIEPYIEWRDNPDDIGYRVQAHVTEATPEELAAYARRRCFANWRIVIYGGEREAETVILELQDELKQLRAIADKYDALHQALGL